MAAEGLKLYSYWRSSAAYRVRIALNLKGLAYEIVPVNLAKDGGEQHGARYHAVNPQELVPVLCDGERVLRQSMAIIEYLDEMLRRAAACCPSTARDRARVRSLAQLIACDIHPLNNLRVLQYLEKRIRTRRRSSASAGSGTGSREGFEALEKLLLDQSVDRRLLRGRQRPRSPTAAWCRRSTTRSAIRSTWRPSRPSAGSTSTASPCAPSTPRGPRSSPTPRGESASRLRSSAVEASCATAESTSALCADQATDRGSASRTSARCDRLHQNASCVGIVRRVAAAFGEADLQRQAVARVGLVAAPPRARSCLPCRAGTATGRRSACLPPASGPSLP